MLRFKDFSFSIPKFLRVITIAIFASVVLSGCVKYDVAMSFDNANSGALVQHIKLSERLTSFSGNPVYEWLNSIERRTRKLEGKTQRISKEDIIITIPFNNAQELQQKFNEFFNPENYPAKQKKGETENNELPKIESNLLLFQKNLLLVVRNHLIYDLDLSSLSLISGDDNVLANTNSILDLDFSLQTPWGAKSIAVGENPIQPVKNDKTLTWKLQAGQLNHVETVFWLPSPVGIGAVLIILLVWLGSLLRYKVLKDPTIKLAETNP